MKNLQSVNKRINKYTKYTHKRIVQLMWLKINGVQLKICLSDWPRNKPIDVPKSLICAAEPGTT